MSDFLGPTIGNCKDFTPRASQGKTALPIPDLGHIHCIAVSKESCSQDLRAPPFSMPLCISEFLAPAFHLGASLSGGPLKRLPWETLPRLLYQGSLKTFLSSLFLVLLLCLPCNPAGKNDRSFVTRGS